MNYITRKFDQGRLGNCLFQIASLVSCAKKYNFAPIFPQWEYSKYFKNHLIYGDVTPTHFYTEPYFHFTPIDLSEALTKTEGEDKVYNLAGYYQSELYFEGHEQLIKELFTPSIEITDGIANRLFLYPECCAIHVRRGDYVNNSYYHNLTMEYYNKAISYIKENTGTKHFMVFSDDIDYCRTMFSGYDVEFVDGYTDIYDLFLMSSCDHFIIANSSYSWWASYLAHNPNKVIVAPNKKSWFGSNSVFNLDDLYCNNWVTL